MMLTLVFVALVSAGVLAVRMRSERCARTMTTAATLAVVVMLAASLTGALSVLVPVLRNAAASAPQAVVDNRHPIERLAEATDDATALPALVDLADAIGDGVVVPSQRSRLIELIRRRVDGPESGPVPTEWATLIVLAWERGWLASNGGDALAGTIMRVEWDGLQQMTNERVDLVADIRKDNTGALDIGGRPRMVWFESVITSARVDGEELTPLGRARPARGQVTVTGQSWSGGVRSFEPSVPAGRYRAVLDLDITMTLGAAPPGQYFTNSDAPGDGERVRWQVQQEIDVDVLAEPVQWMIPVDDEQTRRDAMARILFSTGVPSETGAFRVGKQGSRWMLTGDIKFSEPFPITLQGDLMFIIDGREIVGMPGLRVGADRPFGQSFGLRVALDEAPPDTIDVIFRPAPRATSWRQRYHQEGPIRIWSAELRWDDIMVIEEAAANTGSGSSG